MRRLRVWFRRFQGFLMKDQRERELAEELESHLQMHVEDNLRSGMSPEEARRCALLKLGGIAQTKELYRDRYGIPLLEALFLDIRYAVRSLLERRLYSFVTILTVGLGIGAVTAMFSVVDGVLLRPLPYNQPDRLVAVVVSAMFWILRWICRHTMCKEWVPCRISTRRLPSLNGHVVSTRANHEIVLF
jgi:hypothetical protein